MKRVFLIRVLIGIQFLSLSAGHSTTKEIIPSVINGICSVCYTASCVNCPKSGRSIRRTTQSSETKVCSACDGKGALCDSSSSQRFQDNGTQRSLCADGVEGNCGLSDYRVRSVYIPRSVGANTAREMVGWEEFIHQYNVGDYYLTTGHVLGYSHSIKPRTIARSLFGDCILRFAGSQVKNRGSCELLADNFGLSPFLRGTVTVNPVIENLVLDNQFFFGLDPLFPGLYVRIHAPVVHTRWNLGLKQRITSSSKESTDFPACYMAEEPARGSSTILQALQGNSTFGDMKNPWNFGRMRSDVSTRTGFADIDLIVGCDSWQSDEYHFGFYGQLVIPTGNKPSARFLFDPIIGNARHLEIGVGISGHIILWQRDVESLIAFFCEGNATHLFKNTQQRSFDFCNNGPLSRYMLLKEFITVDNQFIYGGSLSNAIDFATRPVSVSIAIQGDISATFCFRSPCFIADVGYNFYGRSKEQLKFKKRNDDARFFGIKGTEGICGLEYSTINELPVTFGQLVAKVPLHSTQHNATIYHGSCTDNPLVPISQNPGDSVVTAFSRQEGVIEGSDICRAFTSNPPVLVTTNDLHKRSGTLPSQATHKVFGYLGYNFYDWDRCYNPYLGVGGELEIDAFSFKLRNALNQWSVWLKGGFEF
ncbi:hypothetical protein H0X06_03990 [Candidatus Dependentiae bacterium]|nr:hypothetical protein [Candidatus Dependentiae bacterium]